MKRWKPICLQSLRIALAFAGIALFGLQIREALERREFFSLSIAIVFLTLANYSMSWSNNIDQMISLRQRRIIRKASLDLLVAALWTAIGSIDLVASKTTFNSPLLWLLMIIHWLCFAMGLYWGIYGLDTLVKVALEFEINHDHES